MTRLVLVGGGHSHVQVLLALARRRIADLQVTMISRDVLTPYSGMLPGVIAGHYAPGDAHIDLEPLCTAAGAELVHAEVTRLDPTTSTVCCGDRDSWSYDLLAINCGSAPSLDGIPGAAGMGVPVKPISQFLPRWSRLSRDLFALKPTRHRVAVVGGGAGGVELALAMDYRLRRAGGLEGVEITVINAADVLLPGSPPRLGERLGRILAGRGVTVRNGTRVQAAHAGALETNRGESIRVDDVLWVTDAAAQTWPAVGGLAVDASGFVEVDAGLRSLSHPQIFAAGDVARFTPRALPKAGVYAVRQGPLLANNLLRAAAGRPLRSYRPQHHFLTLVSTGDRYAVAARGGWTAEGHWVWHWKDWIDRRFVRRFRFPGR
jgi:selenide,water dikinase